MFAPDLPELIGGKYRPTAVIGVGAMGVVYSVEHILTGETLALKVMTAHQGATRDAIERFKREARASAKIKSEHVVRIIDADVAPELDRAPYLVMDLLEGNDLEKAAADQPVAPAVVIDWLRQIARALDKAHRIGITHRDLKPENLFLSHREDGSSLIKILDFGIAKIAAESTGTTQSGQILGTPLYMSPEQARGDPAQIGPPADLYALGLIAFKLLTGQPYWKATSVAGIIGQVLYEPMLPPSAGGCELGPEFDAWFLRACNRDAAQRFGSAVELVESLAATLGLPSDPQPDGLRSNPGLSGAGLIHQSNPGRSSGDRQMPPAATLVQNGGTLVSSSSSTPDLAAPLAKPKERRRFFYGIMSAAVVLSILVAVFSRNGNPPEPATKTTGARSVLAATLPASAPATPPSSLPQPLPQVAPTPAPAEPAVEARPTRKTEAPALGSPPSKRKEAPKAAPVHSVPAAPPLRIDRTSASDPLGDQK
ncbi:MAG TPA: serine/threonine-protein kinase [Polyangiaceae bacterium]|nr:serine/threonine-protein kinase [Polyangiaceae bacterium]